MVCLSHISNVYNHQLSLFILLTFIVDQFTSVVCEATNQVSCGSLVKLANNEKPKVRLHSHDIKYGSGSGQQSVTAAHEQETSSHWSILGPVNQPCKRGAPIECGDDIRMQHVPTRKFLHSHHFQSPLSANQEVSAFGSDTDSDTGDTWTVYCKTRYWQRNEPVRLKHKDTDVWLSMTSNSYGRPINGHLEVVGSSSSNANSYWKTSEGVFIQPSAGNRNSDKATHDEL